MKKYCILFLIFTLCGTSCLFAKIDSPQTIYILDIRDLKKDWTKPERTPEIWDTLHALAALQGIVNREKPQLYFNYCSGFGVETDEFWMNWYRTEDEWLKETEVVQLKSIEEVFDTFKEVPQGLVVYDPKVNSTSNLASTAAGIYDLIPVRWSEQTNSICQKLLAQYHYPIRETFINSDGSSKFTGKGTIPDTDIPSTGSAKCDAYLWAVEKYIKTGLCDPLFAAYYIDSFWIQLPNTSGPDMHTLSNHDYFISHRAFFFDLSPWADEAPNDDLQQPLGADLTAFRAVMSALYLQNGGRILKVGGFTPWPFKYTNHGAVKCKHGGVETEWQFGKIISQYNGYMEADAAGLSAMANASFHTHYPLQKRYSQPNAKPGLQVWKEKGFITSDGKVKPGLYLGHYVGDYDSPAWLYKAVPNFFNDKDRGTIPLGWAFDPNLADRAPMAFVYAYQKATPNDFFITGDSGAGYLNPRSLTQRDSVPFPSGLTAWAEHCARYMERWDMSIVGFIIDGSGYASGPEEFAVYSRFSPDGCGTHYERESGIRNGGIPACNEWDIDANPKLAARDIAGVSQKYRDTAGFSWCRSILKNPGWYLQLSEILKNDYPDAPVIVVDPYTFFGLLKLSFETAEKH